ncbi:MAG: helix-turn-helix transcriptional regulator [Candidatus Sedimenticola sp. (ex Thyasira tokunagai)]
MSKRKECDGEFTEDFDKGYQAFKIGVLLKQAREASGLTQAEIADKLHTKKSAISRMENHAEDIRLSTLEKFAAVLGRKLEVSIR